MGSRLDFQTLLETLLGSGNVYFQPPPTVQMKYPAIVYNRSAANTMYAGNQPYHYTKRYMVTVIDKDPDSELFDKLVMLPMCTYDRHFTADNLNHDIFNVYF